MTKDDEDKILGDLEHQMLTEHGDLVALGRAMSPMVNRLLAGLSTDKANREASRCAECDCENGGDECTWISAKEPKDK